MLYISSASSLSLRLVHFLWPLWHITWHISFTSCDTCDTARAPPYHVVFKSKHMLYIKRRKPAIRCVNLIKFWQQVPSHLPSLSIYISLSISITINSADLNCHRGHVDLYTVQLTSVQYCSYTVFRLLY